MAVAWCTIQIQTIASANWSAAGSGQLEATFLWENDNEGVEEMEFLQLATLLYKWTIVEGTFL